MLMAQRLPGCGIPKLRGSDPGHDLPASIQGEASPENSSQVGIDEFFSDPILSCLIEEGMAANNQELEKSWAKKSRSPTTRS